MAFISFGVSFIRLISWSHSLCSGNFSNFFLLNKCANGQMYFIKSSRFVGSSSLPISCFFLSVSSISCSLYILNVNEMSWCYILYSLGYLANCIVLIFQFTSGLYLTNQLYFKNISVSFKSITAMLIFSVCLLISHSSGTNLVTSSFLVLSALKTSNYLFISSIFICSSFTSCLSISV